MPLPRKTKKKVWRLVFLDRQGRRNTVFLDTYSILTVEDVTKKVPGWEKFKLQKPTPNDREALLKMLETLQGTKGCTCGYGRACKKHNLGPNSTER